MTLLETRFYDPEDEETLLENLDDVTIQVYCEMNIADASDVNYL